MSSEVTGTAAATTPTAQQATPAVVETPVAGAVDTTGTTTTEAAAAATPVDADASAAAPVAAAAAPVADETATAAATPVDQAAAPAAADETAAQPVDAAPEVPADLPTDPAPADAPVDEVQDPATNISQMPSTPEQLKAFVAYALTDVLNIPENGTHIARVVLSSALRALNDTAQMALQKQNRPVLTRTPYAGCLRAVVSANEVATDEPLTVDITVQDSTGQNWVDTTFPDATLQALAKLVLSQSTVPGDVWYITTTSAVDAQLDATAEALLQQASNGDDTANVQA